MLLASCIVDLSKSIILCTGSKNIILEESQKYFGFLPARHRIDICTARFSWSFQHVWKQFVQCPLRSSTKTREWTFS